MNKKYEYTAVIFMVMAFLGLSVTSMLRKSVTVDEFANLPAGLYAWKARDSSLYGETPKLGLILVAAPALFLKPQVDTILDRFPEKRRPWIYATDFMQRNSNTYTRMFLASRLAVVLAGAVLCLVVWWIAREIYGGWGGICALTAAALSPTLIAYSRLVTTDVPAALFSILFLAMLMEYFERPGVLSILAMTAFFCLATLTDFTCLFWALFLLAAPPLAAFTHFTEMVDRPGIISVLTHIFVALVATWVIFTVAYGIRGAGVPFQGEFRSETLQKLGPAARYTLLPQQLIANIDRNLARADEDEWPHQNYLFGEWYQGRKLYYLAAAYLVKEPVSHLALLLAAILLALVRRIRDRDDIILILAVFGFFVFASFFGDHEQGIRYLLPVYPAAFVLMGRVGHTFLEPVPDRPRGLDVSPIKVKAWKKILRTMPRIIMGAVLVWILAQHVMIWPNYIPYVNLAAQNRYQPHELLLDSNLDWGQDLPGLSQWMKKNKVSGIDLAYFGHDDPARYEITYSLPARSTQNKHIAISANLLMGKKYPMTFLIAGPRPDDPLWAELESFRSREPEAVINSSVFIFKKPQ